jgi:hypothetical protein
MTSQFRIYSSDDAGAPALNGLSGSLIDVLDGCLINGYGTKTPVGWLKPLPNDPTQDLACYQQPSGSGFTLFVNDACPLSASNAETREAWCTGYETLVGLTGSVAGTGYGQFPYTGQAGLSAALTSGSVVVRKSATKTEVARSWVMFADAYTFYLFMLAGDSANQYTTLWFGDIFSFKSTNDAYKCIIVGRVTPNTPNASVTIETSDLIMQPNEANYPHYMARTWGGGGRSIRVVKLGDAGKVTFGNANYASMAGLVTGPNPVDGSVFISPLWVCECDNISIRGRLRGLFFPCHPLANFGDGQVISGTGETSGKTFQIVQAGGNNGQWAVEISDTVETNDV